MSQPPDSRRPADFTAFAIMVVMCAIWGIQQVAVKSIIADVSPVMQGGIRSIVACGCVMLWARARAITLFTRDGTGWAGLAAGALFAAEFVFLYGGLRYTTASRMSVFVYIAPILTVVGLSLLITAERLRSVAWLGLLLAFAGLALAFGERFFAAGASPADQRWIGDSMGVIAAVLWAATTIVIRATSLSNAPATKTLFYQLAASAVVLPIASVLMSEPGVVRITPWAFAVLAFQGVVVAFASYLTWFWLLTRYLAARLSVFAFLTPLFGVLAGAMLLGEVVTGAFLVAAGLVLGGIVLVNLPARAEATSETAPKTGSKTT